MATATKLDKGVFRHYQDVGAKRILGDSGKEGRYEHRKTIL